MHLGSFPKQLKISKKKNFFAAGLKKKFKESEVSDIISDLNTI